VSELPDRPDLDQLRRQARELLRAATEDEPRARARIRAVSERVTLSAAQLALAREYGFPSWPALRTEAEHRRRMSESAARLPYPGGHGRAYAAEDRWSLGGASVIETAAGMLSPRALVVGPGHAALDASLMPSPEAQRRLARPARTKIPGMGFVAALFGQHPDHSEMPRFDDLIVADDRGTRYTLSFDSGVIPREEPGKVRGLVELRLGLDPVPARECGWIELRSHDRPAARLLPSARPVVRVGQLAPAAGSLAERELSEQALSLIELHLAEVGQDAETEDILTQRCSAALAWTAEIRQSGELDTASELPDQIARLCAALTSQKPTGSLPAIWSGMLNAAQRTDGSRHHLDITAALPPVDGTAVQVDTLISEPDTWRVYLRARPGWWTPSEDRHHRRAAMSVRAEDNLGGRYLSTFDGSIGHGGYEELALRFRPRLDPLTRSLKLTFTGADDQVALQVRLAPAAKSGQERPR
jgi:hypothetical protein